MDYHHLAKLHWEVPVNLPKTHHDPAELEKHEFKIIDKLTLSGGSGLWGAYDNRRKPFVWGSEADIQHYVRLAIGDAVASAGIAQDVICQNELSIFQLRPDIWILLSKCKQSRLSTFKRPIGIIEVNKPGDTIMPANGLHGRVLDYLLRLKSFFGLQNVFGISTTYQQWRFYWLPDCDDAAASVTVATSTQDITHEESVLKEDDEETEVEVKHLLFTMKLLTIVYL
jgi:hypothetical protein